MIFINNGRKLNYTLPPYSKVTHPKFVWDTMKQAINIKEAVV